MLKSRRTVAAACSATVLAALAFLAPAASASASPAGPASPAAPASPRADAGCVMTPRVMTLGTKSRAVRFDAPGLTQWGIEVDDLFVFAYTTTDQGAMTTVSLNPKNYLNSDAGVHQALITSLDSEAGDSCATTFRLLRATALALKVTHQHPYRYLTGKLVRADYGPKGGLSPVRGVPVALQYQTAKGAWKTAKVVTTTKTGVYGAKLAAGPHSWRAVYGGAGTTAARISAVQVG